MKNLILFVFLFSSYSSSSFAENQDGTISIDEAWELGFFINIDGHKDNCTFVKIEVPNVNPLDSSLNKPMIGLYYELEDETNQIVSLSINSFVEDMEIKNEAFVCVPNNSNYKMYLSILYGVKVDLDQQLECLKNEKEKIMCAVSSTCTPRWTISGLEDFIKR